jgi:hypothetical protein
MKRFEILILPTALLMFMAVWYLIQPWCQYNLDSDCVAYLTHANSAANGDFQRSVNGLWSPLNGWFLVPFIQKGMNAWQAAQWLNAFIGMGVLFVLHLLFKQWIFSRKPLAVATFTLSLILPVLCFYQMFGDLLSMFFLAMYLYLLVRVNQWKFLHTCLAALIAGIAFYAKAYSVAWFGLHFFLFCTFLYVQKVWSIRQAMFHLFLAASVVLVLILPWSILLYQKYHHFSLTGHAGTLNMSWFINSGKTFREDIQLLIPPVCEGSPSFWEDPYLSQGELSSPFSSGLHFLKWIRRIVYNIILLFGCLSEIHVLSWIILILSVHLLYLRRGKFEPKLWVLISAAITIPLGYLMVALETRYIWLEIPIVMILGLFLLDHYIHSRFKIVFVGLFFMGFLIYPLRSLDFMKDKNKSLFETAAQLKEQGIQGKMTSNASDAGSMWVIAYLSQSSFYSIEQSEYTLTTLKEEMTRYKVKYFLQVNENNLIANCSSDTSFQFITRLPGMDVFEYKGAD